MLVREDTSLPTPLLPSTANLRASLVAPSSNTYPEYVHYFPSSLHLSGPSCPSLFPKETAEASPLASLPPLHCIIFQGTPRVNFHKCKLDQVYSWPNPCQRPPLLHRAKPQSSLAPAISAPPQPPPPHAPFPFPSSCIVPAALAPLLVLGCSFRPSHRFSLLPGTLPLQPGSLPSQRLSSETGLCCSPSTSTLITVCSITLACCGHRIEYYPELSFPFTRVFISSLPLLPLACLLHQHIVGTQ